LDPSILINKGKAIQDSVTAEGVGLTFPHLLKGGTSVGHVGPKNNLQDPELCVVDRIKDKEVAFLAWQQRNFVCSNPCENIPILAPNSKSTTKVDEGRKKQVVAARGLTKCERFAQAICGGKGGRRGKKGEERGEDFGERGARGVC
jgi:hypothetical protein